MRKTLLPLLAASMLILPSARAAQHEIRPGLWEVTTTSDLLRLVPHLQPDQLRQLQQFARQNGFVLPDIQDGAATSKICITPAMAERKIPPNIIERESGCEARNLSQDGGNYRAELVCNGPRISGTGSAKASFSSPERFSGETQFTGEVQGNPLNERAQTTGRWVGADCGSVKPAM